MPAKRAMLGLEAAQYFLSTRWSKEGIENFSAHPGMGWVCDSTHRKEFIKCHPPRLVDLIWSSVISSHMMTSG